MRTVIRFLYILVTFSVIAWMGCSGLGGDIVIPADPGDAKMPAFEGGPGASLWGLWEVSIHKTTGEVSIVRLREADLALNVLGFMEPPAFANMRIVFGTLLIDPDNNYIGVDVVLKHPIPKARFKGFDVKGIVFGPQLTNADGLTRWFNPTDFMGTPFGYTDGLLGVPDSVGNFNDIFNGYKYFADGIGLTESVADFYNVPGNMANRGVFSEGSTNKRHYDLQFGGDYSDFFVFNYAVGASYNWPSGGPPYTLDDFDISTCNQAEPVFIEVVETDNTLYYHGGLGGGKLELEITIFDWDKPVIPETVMVDGGTAFAGTAADFDSDVDANRRLYTFEVNGEPTSTDPLNLVITVTTSKTYGGNYFAGLMPTSHPLYGEGIETKFPFNNMITVSDQPPLNLCEGKTGVPIFGFDESLPTPDYWGQYEDMCTLSDNRLIVHDYSTDFPPPDTTCALLAVTYYPMPVPQGSEWTYVPLSGFYMDEILVQIESDSNDNIITSYEGDDSFDVWDYNGTANSVSHVTTVFLVVGDILAMCVDGNDNLWVLTDNMEMHKFEAGTYAHDTDATFNVGSHVYGWVWDFVIDPFDGKFYILHEDDGTGTIDDGVISKFGAKGTYEDQLVGVFASPIGDLQTAMEDDPGEADIIIDMSDPSESSCRIIAVADYDTADPYNPYCQVVRIRAMDISYIGTPNIDPESWGATCATMSKHTDYGQEIFFVSEPVYTGYIDSFILPPGGVW